MKLILLPLACLLTLAQPLVAQQAKPEDPDKVEWVFQTWCTNKIPSLELTDASFEQGYELLRRAWKDRVSSKDFPFAVTDFEVDPDLKGEAQKVSMSLKDIPFAEAMDLLCKGTSRKIVARSGAFRFEAGPSGDWVTKAHALVPAVREKVFATGYLRGVGALTYYQGYGMRLESWMQSCLVGDRLFVMAGEEQHHQIEIINRLLGTGYTIERATKK